MLMTQRAYRRARCRYQHSVKSGNQWYRGGNESPGILIPSAGPAVWKMQCRGCDLRSPAIPTAVATGEWNLTLADIEWVEDRSGTSSYEPCSLPGCEATPTEYHHFAPTNVFGRDADSWPCLPLCRPHHLEWHRRMDGYRWHAKRTAA